MKRMDIAALYRKPTTSKLVPGHKNYFFLLRKLHITWPNQVCRWTSPIFPCRQICFENRLPGNGWRAGSFTSPLSWTGFTRRVLAWRRSIMLEADFCIEAAEEAVARREIKISMDGNRAWRDNVFEERLRRTIEYEEVYPLAYASVSEASAGIGRHLGF